jgi:hypothetical protein
MSSLPQHKLWSGQASLRRSRRSERKNQTKTADDTIAYLTITSEDDAEHLQEDLDKLAQWGEDWFIEKKQKKRKKKSN